ncbi:hypothetical protein [uncultured Alistipes sp.]|jgi:hypothetical protein|uniref:hypothetical protein n=1 Tax=uncultured Alistipes sp. TaxID=538949 RepID=UPI0025F20D6C|nr:hypothetical protein [uncultured Alistipes sp.]
MRIFRLILCFSLLTAATSGYAQEVFVAADFHMYFDNKEFGSSKFAEPGLDIESGTDFAARLIPKVGVKWDDRNSLVFGVDLLQNFGEKNSSFVSEAKPVIYYQFQSPKVKAVAGIFTRDMTHSDDYSTAFFTDSHKFIHNRMNGVLAQYNSGPSYVEFICDWEGMYSTKSREKFRILSSGRHFFNKFYYGYNFSMFHFAGQKDAVLENVVDAFLVNPAVGVKFNAFFDFDIKLGLLQTMQRDRSFGHKWETPRMGEVGFKMSRWGLTLDEQFFFGNNINPFFHGNDYELEDGTMVHIPYGRELYPNESFFRTDKNFYNRAALSYSRWFFKETLCVKAAFITHHDGDAFTTQQQLQVIVKFFKTVYNSKNHKK